MKNRDCRVASLLAMTAQKYGLISAIHSPVSNLIPWAKGSAVP
jgi:hypothetical protein